MSHEDLPTTMSRASKSQSPEYEQITSLKRKRETDHWEEPDPKQKRKSSKRLNNPEDGTRGSINASIAYMGSSLLADHLAQKTRRFESNLSPIELEDRYISGERSC